MVLQKSGLANVREKLVHTVINNHLLLISKKPKLNKINQEYLIDIHLKTSFAVFDLSNTLLALYWQALRFLLTSIVLHSLNLNKMK